MSNYKKIAADALKKANKVNTINEEVLYKEKLVERMHPTIEDQLCKRTHSLGKHPIFPDSDESNFEEKIMSETFNDIVKQYKRSHEVETIDNSDVIRQVLPMVKETMMLEHQHRKELEKLAVKMIREEYSMDENIVEIHAELVENINLLGTKKNKKPLTTEMEFNNHDDIVNANKEVLKRRFVNSMIQGASMKSNNMFHMIGDELTDIDPRLPNKYSKLMSASEYCYYIIPNLEDSTPGGVVKVQFPTKDNPKAIIYAQAMVLPVLIHELVKGVMELLSGHGLPKNKKIGQFVIDKADYLGAEPWDMRLGSGLWSRFTNMIEPNDFNLKHHIYSELVSLPVDEFNIKMREIISNTKEGKKIVKEIVDEVKEDLKNDEFNESLNKATKKKEIKKETEGFTLDELLNGFDRENNDSNDDSWEFDDIL